MTKKTPWEVVGESTIEKARWLLDFSARDLDHAPTTELLKSRMEARAFVTLGALDPKQRPMMRHWPIAPESALGRKETLELQSWLKAGLERMALGEAWRFQPEVEFQLGWHRSWRCLTYQTPKGTVLNVFMALTYQLLQEARGHVRSCDCGQFFVPVRRQAYCSIRCSQRARTRRWRHSHPQQARQLRRAQYEKQLARKLKLTRLARIRVRRRRVP